MQLKNMMQRCASLSESPSESIHLVRDVCSHPLLRGHRHVMCVCTANRCVCLRFCRWVCEGQLYTLYVDNGNCFSQDEFWALKGLLDCTHECIHLKWICDLNQYDEAQLASNIRGEQQLALHEGKPVCQAIFSDLVSRVKAECSSAASALMKELKSRFPAHAVLDALGIVYLQYWVQSQVEESFKKHLEVLKKFYGEPRVIVEGQTQKHVPLVLNSWTLNNQ